jgi:hypothetical protein
MSLEFYIRLALGQFGEIATRLDLLQGKRLEPDKVERVRRLCEELEEVVWGDGTPWRLDDDETSLYTLMAFGMEARLVGNDKGRRWAQRRIDERAKFERIDHRESVRPANSVLDEDGVMSSERRAYPCPKANRATCAKNNSGAAGFASGKAVA